MHLENRRFYSNWVNFHFMPMLVYFICLEISLLIDLFGCISQYQDMVLLIQGSVVWIFFFMGTGHIMCKVKCAHYSFHFQNKQYSNHKTIPLSKYCFNTPPFVLAGYTYFFILVGKGLGKWGAKFWGCNKTHI